MSSNGTRSPPTPPMNANRSCEFGDAPSTSLVMSAAANGCILLFFGSSAGS